MQKYNHFVYIFAFFPLSAAALLLSFPLLCIALRLVALRFSTFLMIVLVFL